MVGRGDGVAIGVVVVGGDVDGARVAVAAADLGGGFGGAAHGVEGEVLAEGVADGVAADDADTDALGEGGVGGLDALVLEGDGAGALVLEEEFGEVAAASKGGGEEALHGRFVDGEAVAEEAGHGGGRLGAGLGGGAPGAGGVRGHWASCGGSGTGGGVSSVSGAETGRLLLGAHRGGALGSEAEVVVPPRVRLSTEDAARLPGLLAAGPGDTATFAVCRDNRARVEWALRTYAAVDGRALSLELVALLIFQAGVTLSPAAVVVALAEAEKAGTARAAAGAWLPG